MARKLRLILKLVILLLSLLTRGREEQLSIISSFLLNNAAGIFVSLFPCWEQIGPLHQEGEWQNL